MQKMCTHLHICLFLQFVDDMRAWTFQVNIIYVYITVHNIGFRIGNHGHNNVFVAEL